MVVNGNGARALLALEALSPGRRLRGCRRGAYCRIACRQVQGVHIFRGRIRARRGAPCEGAHGGACRAERFDQDLRKRLTAAAAAAFNPRKLVRLETVEDFLPTDTETTPPPAVVCSPGQCLPVYSAGELTEALASLAGGPGSGGDRSASAARLRLLIGGRRQIEYSAVKGSWRRLLPHFNIGVKPVSSTQVLVERSLASKNGLTPLFKRGAAPVLYPGAHLGPGHVFGEFGCVSNQRPVISLHSRGARTPS